MTKRLGCAICAERVSSRGAALQASGAKSCMPPKALSRFAELGEVRGRRHRRARGIIHSGQRRLHAHEPRSCRRHSGEARDRLWRGGSRSRISVNSSRSTPFTLVGPSRLQLPSSERVDVWQWQRERASITIGCLTPHCFTSRGRVPPSRPQAKGQAADRRELFCLEHGDPTR